MARKTYTLQFYFNPKAAESLAKELRRASWGIAVAAAAGGMKAPESAAWVVVGSAIIWAILQCAAFALESLKNEEKDAR